MIDRWNILLQTADTYILNRKLSYIEMAKRTLQTSKTIKLQNKQRKTRKSHHTECPCTTNQLSFLNSERPMKFRSSSQGLSLAWCKSVCGRQHAESTESNELGITVRVVGISNGFLR